MPEPVEFPSVEERMKTVTVDEQRELTRYGIGEPVQQSETK